MTSAILPRGKLLEAFCARFGVAERNVLQQIDYYNFDYGAYDNEIYELPSTRLAHWWNFESHNWFAHRIDLYLDRIEAMRDVLLVDIGFSIPYLDTRPSFAQRTDISTILVDSKESAAEFYSLVRELVTSRRAQHDAIIIADIEAASAQSEIIAAAKKVVDERQIKHVIVAASEVVEHLNDPGRFWAFSAALTNSLGVETVIYATLPVAAPIPSHHTVFEDEASAMTYLVNSFLVDETRILRPPGPTTMHEKLTHRGCICAFGHVE